MNIKFMDVNCCDCNSENKIISVIEFLQLVEYSAKKIFY